MRVALGCVCVVFGVIIGTFGVWNGARFIVATARAPRSPEGE